MAEETKAETPRVANEIDDQTGQFDARFMLWRTFCAENSVPVETLPSELTGDVKTLWEKLKNNELHRPAEK